jgi:ABC-type bacteriocin/lantibiotic exporter with double-glycine peptidase domain
LKAMRYQPKDSGLCGPVALQNALLALGKRASLKRLIALSNASDSRGTSQHGIIRAGRALGLEVEEFSWDKDREARQWLLSNATLGIPTILCVDNWEHWIAVAGHCGPRVWLFDSTNEPENTRENGAWCLTPAEVTRRWKAAKGTAGDSPRFYGISIQKIKDR